MRVKLFKTINGERRLVDFGVMSMVYEYELMGYEVEISTKNDGQRTYAVNKAEFDRLHATLDKRNRYMVRDLYTNEYNQTIEERLMLLKAHIATHCKPVHKATPVVKRVRKSLWTAAKNLFQSLVPEPAFA